MMEEKTSITSFSDVLKEFRKQKKITQRRLAERVGVHHNTISMWERGSYLPESKGIVLTLAKELALNDEQTRQLLEASLTALNPYWNVPHQRNPFFTGRESILLQLYELLYQKNSNLSSLSCALCGLGGIGKTQIALEYAYRYFQEYSAVFWIHADTSESLISSYVSIAHLLQLPELQIGKQDRIVAAVTQWLNKHSDWLLIIDNIEDIELIKPLLPTARKGSLLFTTQLSTLGGLAESIQLEPIAQSEGAQLLLRRIRSTSSAHYQPAIELAGAMGGLPLALDQAGAYIEETHCNISDYLDLYQKHHIYLLQHRGRVVIDHPSTVYATLSLCFEKIQQRTPSAIELLYLCAFFAPDAIPEELIHEVAALSDSPLASPLENPLQLNEMIRELLAYSLLFRDPGSKIISIHRLVQDVLKDMMDEKNQRVWAERAVQAVNKRFPDSRSFTSWSDCQKYLPHAQLCITFIEKYQLAFPEAAQLLLQTGMFLLQQAQYTQAERLLLLALNMYQHQLEGEHSGVADCLNNLATLYHFLGNNTQAESMLQEGLAIYQQFYGPEHQGCAEWLSDLSTIYFSQKKYALAEESCSQALSIWEKHLGPDHPDIAVSLNNLAKIYQAQEKYEQVEAMLLRAGTIWKNALGEEHPTLAFAITNLAKLYQQQGNFSQARALFEQALVIREKALSSEHPRVARSLLDLASLHLSEGNNTIAAPLAQRALDTFKRVFGKNHPDTILASEMLAASAHIQNTSPLRVSQKYSEADMPE